MAPSGSGSSRARLAWPNKEPVSSPSWARKNTSRLVAQRVCTTERSLAKSRLTPGAAWARGELASAVKAVAGRPGGTWRSASRTSLVVPEREKKR